MAEDFSNVSTEQLLQIALGRMPAKEDAIDASAKAAMVPSGIERVGRGMQDFYQGTKQKALNWLDPAAAEQYTQTVNDETSRYDRGRTLGAEQIGQKHPGIDWMRIGGNIATPLALIPGGGASVAARAGMGAVAGGLGGYTNFNPENSESSNLMGAVKGATIGGAANVVAPPLINGAIRLGQGAINRATQAGRSALQSLTPRVENQITNNVRVVCNRPVCTLLNCC